MDLIIQEYKVLPRSTHVHNLQLSARFQCFVDLFDLASFIADAMRVISYNRQTI